MRQYFVCFLFLFVSVVYSQGVGPDSDRCLKHLVPEVAKCDAEIAVIDKDCSAGFQTIDSTCKGKDTVECITKYLQLTKSCEEKRKTYKTRCGPLYLAVKKECSGPHVVPSTGPESVRCIKILVAQIAICDAEIASIEKVCNEGIQSIDKECKGKDTEACGKRYLVFNAGCDVKRRNHTAKCAPIYLAYRKECLGILSAPATGPESDRCMKQLLPSIQACDREIAAIDVECAQGFQNIDAECKGKDTIECLQKYVQYTATCNQKRQTYNTKCVPLYAAHKNECTGSPVAPLKGPESDRCLKQLVPALAVCDAELLQIDNHCNQMLMVIDGQCKGKDTEECGKKYVQFNAECDGKRKAHTNKCGPTMTAYKAECVVKPG